MSDADDLAPVADARRALLDRLGLECDAGDPAASIQTACTARPEAVAGELDRLATALCDGDASSVLDTDAGSDLDAETAGRYLYALVDCCGPSLYEAAPTAFWRAIDAVRTRQSDASPAGAYARATAHECPFPDRPNTRDRMSVDEVRSRIDDRETRRPATFLCAKHAIPNGLETAVATGLLDPDDAIRTWAAKALDYTEDIDPSTVVDDLFDAVDDELPVVRAGTIGALCQRLLLEESVPEWSQRAMEALADALTDEASVVRLRAAGLLACYPSYLVDSECWSTLDPETRGRLAVGVTRVDPDETAADRPTWEADSTLVAALRPVDTWAVEEEFRELAWAGDEPDDVLTDPHRRARHALATAAITDPGGLTDPDRYVRDVRARSAGDGVDVFEAQLLRVLAKRDIDAVTDAVSVLVESLDTDDPDEASRESARTLARIEERYPDAVSVEQETLVAAIGGTTRRGYLKPARLAALAVVDPTGATESVRDACEAVDEYGDDVGNAIGAVAEANRSVLLDVVDEAVTAIDAIDGSGLDAAFSGLASLAESDPEAVAPHASLLATHLASTREVTRTAAARSLAAIGRADGDAVPSTAQPLVHESGDPDDPVWPAGVVARDDPAAGRQLVADATVPEALDSYMDAIRYAGFLVEVAAGNPELGRECAGWLVASLMNDPAADGRAASAVEDLPPIDPDSSSVSPTTAARTLSRLADEHPDVVAPYVDDLLSVLEHGALETRGTRGGVQAAIGSVADERPDEIVDHLSGRFSSQWDPEVYGRLLSAIAAEDPDAGGELLDELLYTVDRDESAAFAVKKFVQADPAVATTYAEAIVEVLAYRTPVEERDLLRSLTWMAVNASEKPVRDALAEHYPDREAFLEQVDEPRAEKVVSTAGFETGTASSAPSREPDRDRSHAGGGTNGGGSDDGSYLQSLLNRLRDGDS